jgi:hypothetical protein
MPAVNGSRAIVNSWGTTNSGLVSGGVAPSLASITLNALQGDSTVYKTGGVVAMLNTPGIIDGTGTITTLLNPAIFGNQGLVTAGSNYDTGAKAWSIAIAIGEGMTTEFIDSATGVTFQSYIPMPYSWSGSYTCNLDSAVAITLPGIENEIAQFKYRSDDPTDHVLSGLISVNSFSASAPINGVAEVEYSFTGSDQIGSIGGTTATPIFGATVGAFSATALDITLTDGTQVVADAFPTAININCDPQSLITVETSFRYTGSVSVT